MTSPTHLHELFELRPLTRALLKSDRRITSSAEPNGRPSPLFMLSRGIAGVVWGVRTDVPADIAGELDHCVLEPATRAEEGNQPFAGAARCRERTGLTPVRAAGQEPDAVETRQAAGAGHLVSADPVRVDDQALALAQRVYQAGDALVRPDVR